MAQVLASVSISRRSVPCRGALIVWLIFDAEKPWSISRLDRQSWKLAQIVGYYSFWAGVGKLVRNHGARAHGAMVGGAKTHCSCTPRSNSRQRGFGHYFWQQ